MKTFVLAVGMTLVLGLQGCVSTGPKLTPEQAKAKWVSTLNVYPDNRVAMKVRDKQGRTKWSWTSEADRVLALEIDGTLHNTRDIKQIAATSDRNNNQDLVVEFRDGHSLKTYAAGYGGSYSGARWVECDTNRKCVRSFPLRSYAYQQNLGGLLTAIYAEELFARSFKRDPKFDYSSDYRAIPQSTDFDLVTFAIDDEYAKLQMWRADMEKRWSDGESDRAQEAEVAARAAANRENAFWATVSSARQFTCRSTSYSCSDRGYHEATNLDCGAMKFSVGDLLRRGWVVADAKSQWVAKSIGEMCDHNVFYLTFRK